LRLDARAVFEEQLDALGVQGNAPIGIGLGFLLEHAGARGLRCAALDPQLAALEVQVTPAQRA
jgi:hypothetical protein